MADEKQSEDDASGTRQAKEPLFNIDDAEVPSVLPDESWSTEKLAEAAANDKNVLVRSNAVSILGVRSGREAEEALISALKDSEHLIRSTAMVKLAERGKDIVDRMIEALSDEQKDIRAGAAWVLGEIKDLKAVEHLKRAAEDKSAEVRVQAKASLMAMGLLKAKKPS